MPLTAQVSEKLSGLLVYEATRFALDKLKDIVTVANRLLIEIDNQNAINSFIKLV
jgi:hypothetical protein